MSGSWRKVAYKFGEFGDLSVGWTTRKSIWLGSCIVTVMINQNHAEKSRNFAKRCKVLVRKPSRLGWKRFPLMLLFRSRNYNNQGLDFHIGWGFGTSFLGSEIIK